jgi:hypothetical protein
MDEPWHYINAVKGSYKAYKSDASVHFVSQKIGRAVAPRGYLPL